MIRRGSGAVQDHGTQSQDRAPRGQGQPGHSDLLGAAALLGRGLGASRAGGAVRHQPVPGSGHESSAPVDQDHPAGRLGAMAEAVAEPTGHAGDRTSRGVSDPRCLCLDRQQSGRGPEALSPVDRRSSSACVGKPGPEPKNAAIRAAAVRCRPVQSGAVRFCPPEWKPWCCTGLHQFPRNCALPYKRSGLQYRTRPANRQPTR
jgi:hypothetical protein